MKCKTTRLVEDLLILSYHCYFGNNKSNTGKTFENKGYDNSILMFSYLWKKSSESSSACVWKTCNCVFKSSNSCGCLSNFYKMKFRLLRRQSRRSESNFIIYIHFIYLTYFILQFFQQLFHSLQV